MAVHQKNPKNLDIHENLRSIFATMKKQNNSAYIILLLAALLFFFIKINQRGKKANIRERITVENATDFYTKLRDTTKPFTYTNNIICKMDCEKITKVEVDEILKTGELNFAGEKDPNMYPIVGKTTTGKNLIVRLKIDSTSKQVYTIANVNSTYKCENCN